MLIQLNIKEFGIIENATIELKKGLTVLTGETGAGKSMMLAAISQLSGQRTSTSYIRHGQDRAYVEGVFDYPQNSELDAILKENDIDIDETIILTRYIYSSGKSVCKVNGSVVNLTKLKKISSYLLDIHEQHDNQILLVEKNHLKLLDSYINTTENEIYIDYKKKYEKFKNLEEKIKDLEEKESSILQKVDFIKFQLQELDKVSLKENEDIEIQEELDYLENYEKIDNLTSQVTSILNRDSGVLEEVYEISNILEKIATYNNKFEEKAEEVKNIYYILDDLKYEVSKFSSDVDYDEGRLNELSLRLSKIKTLEKKYSKNVNELIIFQENLRVELTELENYEENYETYKEEYKFLEKEIAEAAEKLSNLRKEAAKRLEVAVQEELKFLCMDKSVIKIDFEPKSYTKSGSDEVRILISANQGEPLKSLSKVASGGELSRVMLALKIIFSKSIEAVSIIFDEIDTGVSGRVSQRMAEKMYQLAVGSQVICISHLPQTTALADNNLLISKSVKDDRTVSEILELSQDEKIQEIARMISGTEYTKLAQEHAVEMVNIAREIQEKSGENNVREKR